VCVGRRSVEGVGGRDVCFRVGMRVVCHIPELLMEYNGGPGHTRQCLCLCVGGGGEGGKGVSMRCVFVCVCVCVCGGGVRG